MNVTERPQTLGEALREIAAKEVARKTKNTARMCSAQRHRRNMELLKKLREKREETY